jgi:apolipoprotein N-acyltransferase
MINTSTLNSDSATIAASREGVAAIAAGGLLALCSGVLVFLAFDPVGAWPLIFVAFVPMLLAQHAVLPPRYSGLGPGIGIACLFAHALSGGLADGGVAWYYQLWPLYVALLISLLCARSRAFHERTGYRWFLVSFPSAWVAIDFLRSTSGVDFLAATWGNPAYALYGEPWLLQPLSLVGIFGLQWLLLVVNFAIARTLLLALEARERGAVNTAGVLRPAAIGGILLLTWALLSVALLDNAEPTLRVAAVQPNAVLDAEEEYRRDIAMTREAAAQGAELVVWRENGLRFNPLEENTAELRALAAETGTVIAMGFGYESERGHHNEALVLTPDGRFHGPYGKTHPGRFAGDFSDTGGHFEVYPTPVGPLATIICYDLDFTDTARKMARLGARVVAVPSADVPSIARTHYTHLVFRAIENRVAMVKADNTFDSAIIDPWGRVLALELNAWSVAETEANARGETPPALLVADVPPGSADSLYVRLGDWVGWVTLLATAVFFLFSLRRTAGPR